MPAYEYKYTDRDVREDPRLTWAVKEYLNQYNGDFQFLNDAKYTLAVSRGELPVGVIRGVLNCMRTDPRCANWGLPIPPPASERIAQTVLPFPKLSLVNVNRPYRIRLRANFKYTYLLSLWKTAYLVHLLDPRKSTLWWITRTGTIEAELATWCYLSWTHKRNLIMTDTIPEGRIVCRRCIANQEAYG